MAYIGKTPVINKLDLGLTEEEVKALIGI